MSYKVIHIGKKNLSLATLNVNIVITLGLIAHYNLVPLKPKYLKYPCACLS